MLFTSIYLCYFRHDSLALLCKMISFFSQGQDLYTVMPGSFMSQAPGGVPVAVPIQAGCGMAAVQTGMQGGQPQTVLVPASGVVRNQGQFVQVPPTRAMATDRQLAEMPPSYGQGKYMPLKTEQV